MPDLSSILSFAAGAPLDNRVRIVAVIVTAVMLGLVLELVRRRRLIERYALLWMVVALILLVLAIWNQLLAHVSHAVGIEVPANALFIAGLGLAFILLLHFSVITTRLSEETKILAQEVARLDAEARAARAAAVNGEPAPHPSADGPPAERQSGRSASTADQ
ncbi:MAG: DUF2304 domain-containing protein [Solirubrobacterales bacterium]